MIQALLRSDIWGLYERSPSEKKGHKFEEYEERIRRKVYHDFRLDTIPYYADVDKSAMGQSQMTFLWKLEYFKLPGRDIAVLEKILISDSCQRPTATEILQSGWLDDI